MQNGVVAPFQSRITLYLLFGKAFVVAHEPYRASGQASVGVLAYISGFHYHATAVGAFVV